MATLHGETANIGDKVYDLTRGTGTIVGNEGDVIDVRYASGINIQFNPNGFPVGKSHRQLFWRDPIVYIPTKDEEHWGNLKSVLDAMIKLFVREKGA